MILTLAMLDGRDVLGTGLGLGAFMLLLLPAAGSREFEVLLEPAAKLLGLLFAEEAPGAAAGAGGAALCFGGGCDKTVTAAGRTNMPLPMSHSK